MSMIETKETAVVIETTAHKVLELTGDPQIHVAIVFYKFHIENDGIGIESLMAEKQTHHRAVRAIMADMLAKDFEEAEIIRPEDLPHANR